MKYELKSKNYNGEFISHGIFDTIDEARASMVKILNKKDIFPVYYRYRELPDYTWIDYGSHSDFFYIYKIIL